MLCNEQPQHRGGLTQAGLFPARTQCALSPSWSLRPCPGRLQLDTRSLCHYSCGRKHGDMCVHRLVEVMCPLVPTDRRGLLAMFYFKCVLEAVALPVPWEEN